LKEERRKSVSYAGSWCLQKILWNSIEYAMEGDAQNEAFEAIIMSVFKGC
jgi:hypothetical protein